jgi:hypothetical protein
MTQTEDIQLVYDRYREALMDRDGQQVAGIVTEESVRQFERLRDHALYLDADSVRLLPITEALVVLLVRLRYTAEELEALDGRDFLAEAVGQGWIGREGTQRLEIGAIHIAGDEATADVIHDGHQTAMRMRFVRQDGAWKMRFDHTLSMGDNSLIALGTKHGLSAVQTVEAVLSQQAPDADMAKLWEPLRQRR